MNKIILFICCFNCFGAIGQIQLFYFDKNPLIEKEALGQMFLASKKLEQEIESKGHKIGRLDVLEIENEVFALARGRLDVYQWLNGSWVNLYQGIFHGHNFYSKNFTRNNEIYSFGGYGYWSRHGQLIRFSKQKGDWELVECTRDLDYSLAYMVEKGLRLFGYESVEIDMENQVLVPYDTFEELEQFKFVSNLGDIEFEHYIYFPSSRPVIAVDKRTHTFYYSDNRPFTHEYSQKSGTGIFHIYGDTVIIYNEDVKQDKRVSFPVELENYYKAKQNEKLFSFPKWFIFLSAGILLTLIFFLWFLSRKNKTRSNHELYDIIRHLRERKEGSITMAELDILLQLQHIENPDTIKFKRAQMIQDINHMHQYSNNKPLIERIKDATDKRKYIYLINK